jgi:hypothetical protein
VVRGTGPLSASDPGSERPPNPRRFCHTYKLVNEAIWYASTRMAGDLDVAGCDDDTLSEFDQF